MPGDVEPRPFGRVRLPVARLGNRGRQLGAAAVDASGAAEPPCRGAEIIRRPRPRLARGGPVARSEARGGTGREPGQLLRGPAPLSPLGAGTERNAAE